MIKEFIVNLIKLFLLLTLGVLIAISLIFSYKVDSAKINSEDFINITQPISNISTDVQAIEGVPIVQPTDLPVETPGEVVPLISKPIIELPVNAPAMNEVTTQEPDATPVAVPEITEPTPVQFTPAEVSFGRVRD